MNVGLRIRKIVRLFITFAMFLFIMVVIHELWHYFAGYMVGAEVTIPQIMMHGFWGGECAVNWALIHSDWQWRIIYFAGGVGSAIIPFGILWLFARLSPTSWDMNVEFSCGVIAALQLGAGLAEGLAAREPGYATASVILMLVCFIPMMLYEGLRWANWFVNDKAT